MLVEYFKKTLKHSIIYGIGGLVNKLIGFILIPLYTRVLTPSDYGVLSLITITGTVVTIMLSLGLQTGIFRFYSYEYAGKGRERERKELVGTIFLFLIIFLIIVISILIAYSEQISVLLFKNAEYGLFLKIIFLYVFFETGIIISLSLLRAQEKSKYYSTLIVTGFTLRLLLIILFVVIFKEGILGILKGELFASIIYFIIALPVTIKSMSLSFSFKKLKSVLSFCLPLVPAALAMWVINMIDRYLLERLSGTSEVGLYSLGYNFGMIINALFVAPIQLAWPTILWSILREKKAKMIFSYLMTYFVLAGAFLGLGLSIMGKDIIKIFTTPPFYDAYKVIPIITLSYLFFGIFHMVGSGVSLRKKTKVMPFVVGAAAVINIALNLLWIPKYGMLGSAYATLISYFALFLINYFVNQFYYTIKYQFFRIIKIFVAALLLFIINSFVPAEPIIFSIAARSIILLIYPFLLYLFRFYEPREIRKTINFIKFKILKQSIKNN